MITKEDKINYLIDVKCYIEEDAKEYVNHMTIGEKDECEEYTNGK